MPARATDLIIPGGVNIHPAEVEAVLLGHLAVADAAVLGTPREDRGQQVTAVVEVTEGHQPGEDLTASLLGHCG